MYTPYSLVKKEKDIVAPSLETGSTNKLEHFHFQNNVQTQGNLSYMEASQNPIHVVAFEYDAEGNIIRQGAGDQIGHTIYVNVPQGQATQETAERLHQKMQYDGYRGYFQTFLLPYTTFGNHVLVEDGRFRGHTGTYLVQKTITFVNDTTNYRRVYLARRIDV